MANSLATRQNACNVCGSKSFQTGPNRRRWKRLLPLCACCGSLERHRAIRAFWECMPLDFLRPQHVLQFSGDVAVDSRWFASYELSVYEGINSLDLQNIDREAGSYDIIICNHVLEHVRDDRRALQELNRVTHEDGFIQLSVPCPATRDTTVDWGYPKPEEFGHYREYGRDFEERFADWLPGVYALVVDTTDPVMNHHEVVYAFSRSASTIQRIEQAVKNRCTYYWKNRPSSVEAKRPGLLDRVRATW